MSADLPKQPHTGPAPSALEPLADLARFAFEQAPHLCRPEHGCADYHRAWSALRLFDQGGASPLGWSSIQRELQRLRAGARVLISGSADTGLLAIVAAALPDDARARIVLAERCATTLEQNRHFAQHLGRRVEFHLGDVRRLSCDPVDAIIAHSFLVYFDPDAQQSVVNRWAQLLTPGGVVILSNRLAPAHLPPRVRVEATANAARLPDILARARASGWSENALAALAQTARTFWELPPTQPITEERMRALLAGAGLSVERLTYDDGLPTGPMTRRYETTGYRRAEVIARKAPGRAPAPAGTHGVNAG